MGNYCGSSLLKGGCGMNFFEYDTSSSDAEYYEILQDLMERWEYEIVEFKEAKGNYSEEKIGQYFFHLLTVFFNVKV